MFPGRRSMNNLSVVLDVLKAARQEAALLATYTHVINHAYRWAALDYVIDLLTDEEYLQKQAEYFKIKDRKGNNEQP
jgi:hypothetical protein